MYLDQHLYRLKCQIRDPDKGKYAQFHQASDLKDHQRRNGKTYEQLKQCGAVFLAVFDPHERFYEDGLYQTIGGQI